MLSSLYLSRTSQYKETGIWGINTYKISHLLFNNSLVDILCVLIWYELNCKHIYTRAMQCINGANLKQC